MNRRVGLRISFGTVATILLVCGAIPAVLQADFPKEVAFDLTVDSFQEFFARLHDMLENYCVTTRHGHCVLKYEMDNKKKTSPEAWIRVAIYEADEYKAALFLRSDTLYLLAFADKDGIVHYMNGYDDVFATFSDATSLPFSENYGDITDRDEKEKEKGDKVKTADLLVLLPLGRNAAQVATNDLSNYDPSENKVASVKRAILTFVVMVAESLRFKPVSARCSQYWEEGSTLMDTEARMLVKWSDFSKLFYNKELDEPATKYAEFMKEISVKTIGDLGGILDFVLQPRPKDIKAADSPGPDFNPDIIHVAAAEDVNMKILSFSRKGSRSIYILSASGVISNVTLCRPSSLGRTVTYEGRFELLSLSGHFMPTDRDGSRNCSGRMSVALAAPQGHVLRGRVAGLLVAAAPVQVKVGRLFSRHHQAHHLDKNWTAKAPATGGSSPLKVT